MGTITRNAANNFTTGGVILPAAINDTSVASISELENAAAGSALTLISEQTASNSSSISFTSGIDSTYPIYRFEFINIHPQTDSVKFQFNLSTDGGSNYNVTKTTSHFWTANYETLGIDYFTYGDTLDLAQSTSFQIITDNVGNQNDESSSGTMTLFNPSSDTFVKHFMTDINTYGQDNSSYRNLVAGYGNTTNAIDAVQFKMASGNIDSGKIKLYGISGS